MKPRRNGPALVWHIAGGVLFFLGSPLILLAAFSLWVVGDRITGIGLLQLAFQPVYLAAALVAVVASTIREWWKKWFGKGGQS